MIIKAMIVLEQPTGYFADLTSFIDTDRESKGKVIFLLHISKIIPPGTKKYQKKILFPNGYCPSDMLPSYLLTFLQSAKRQHGKKMWMVHTTLAKGLAA